MMGSERIVQELKNDGHMTTNEIVIQLANYSYDEAQMGESIF